MSALSLTCASGLILGIWLLIVRAVTPSGEIRRAAYAGVCLVWLSVHALSLAAFALAGW